MKRKNDVAAHINSLVAGKHAKTQFVAARLPVRLVEYIDAESKRKELNRSATIELILRLYFDLAD